MEEYIREVTLPHILKALKINLRMLLMILLLLSVMVVTLLIINNKIKHHIYSATGAIQINNYVPNNYLSQDISGTTNDNSTSLINSTSHPPTPLALIP